MKIEYPETLVNLWKYTHQIKTPGFDESKAEEAADSVKKILISHFTGTEEDKQDCAGDYYTQMITAAKAPVDVRSSTVMIARAKKYLAQKNNPVQYEMDDILREALLTLEKDGVIQRDKASQGHRISGMSFFAFKGTPDEKKSSMDVYEKNKHSVSNFTVKCRGDSPEHTRMLAPSDAVKLVKQLLTAFDGWVKKPDLLRAMKNHIPEQMQIISDAPLKDDDGNSGSRLANSPDPHDIVDEFDEFDRIQYLRIARTTSEKIWTRICAVSDKVFCLYSLPKLSGIDVKMKDLGSTSTVSDQNEKFRKIMKEEIKYYWDFTGAYKGDIVKFALEKIFKNLYGRCTESGYNSPLYSGEMS